MRISPGAFTLRNCFGFSSINVPTLQQQDSSRLGILELQPFLRGSEPPGLDDWHLPEFGRKLQRCMIDELWRLETSK